uniref:B30.2/SPRY domain-containing protein n=1 Tax=Neogobius melanostomus TaxID=47308 RepID=A0A8C6SSI9_9GOBI
MGEKVRSLEERIRLTEAELDTGGDGVQFLKDKQEAQKSQCADLRKPKWTFLINVAKHLGNLTYSVWNKMRHSALYSPVTLDPRTAGQGRTVPYPLNALEYSPNSPSTFIPDHPERFHPYSAVLAREGFSSGMHCWDIEVDDCDNWTVGVASQSISRRVQFEACPEVGLWCICLQDGQYLALTTPAQTLSYDMSHPLKRIHVRLDFDSGVLEFNNAENDTRVFAFEHDFTETVYPYFESISKTGSLTVVPQEASVSVTLEGDIVDDITENQEIDRSETDSKSREKKTKKCIVKNGLIKTKPTIKETPGKIVFSSEYHVSLFRLQKISAATCNQIKHG